MECYVDFAGGMHGHFLEYIVSKYIYGKEIDDDIFDEAGTCDSFVVRPEYYTTRVVTCGHFSTINKDLPRSIKTRKKAKKVIHIEFNSALRYNFIFQINRHEKSGFFYTDDFTSQQEERLAAWPSNRKKTVMDRLIRGESLDADRTCLFTCDKFEFDYTAFFDFAKFVVELRDAANFLNRSLEYDDSLFEIWSRFISLNQGFIKYTICEELILDIIANNDVEIIDDCWIHGYLNVRLSQIFGIYDGPLFDTTPYPTSASEAHDIIMKSFGDGH